MVIRQAKLTNIQWQIVIRMIAVLLDCYFCILSCQQMWDIYGHFWVYKAKKLHPWISWMTVWRVCRCSKTFHPYFLLNTLNPYFFYFLFFNMSKVVMEGFRVRLGSTEMAFCVLHFVFFFSCCTRFREDKIYC